MGACKAGTEERWQSTVYLHTSAHKGALVPIFKMDTFDFESWCKDGELSSKVVSALKKENMTSVKCLQLVKDSDVLELGLNRGDSILLLAAVKALRPGAAPAPVSTAAPLIAQTSGSGDSFGLHELLKTIDSSQEPENRQSTNGGSSDPLVYLECKRGEALKIVDFLSANQDDNEVELGNGITMKLPSQKPKLDKVSPAMWGAANLRIMVALLKDNKLDSVLDYVAYTIKIHELACRFSWQSVLLYDQEYRALQATHAFRWGTDTPHLTTVALREKPQSSQQQQQGRGHGGAGSTNNNKKRVAPSGREYCLQWNKGACAFGSRCNFEHICIQCNKDHKGCDHVGPTGQHAASGGARGGAHTAGQPGGTGSASGY